MGIGTSIKKFIKNQAKKRASKVASKAIAKTMADAGINKIGKDTSGVSKIVDMMRHPIKTIMSSLGIIGKAVKNATDITGQLGADNAIETIKEPITPVSNAVKDIEKESREKSKEEQYEKIIERLKAKIDYRMSTAGERGWGGNDEKTESSLAQQRHAVNGSYIKASQLIDMAVKKNGYKETAIALKNWEGKFEDEIIRLEAAIYDGEYAVWGTGGKAAYEFKLRELVRALELDKGDFTNGYEAFIADFK